LKRYDGTINSLKDRSRRPKTHPTEHSEEEKQLIKKVLNSRKGRDLIYAYQILKNKGYTRSYGGFKRMAQKLKVPATDKKVPKKKPKPYERAEFPGQKVQIDVKQVPSRCITSGQKYYQFTAKDECTRWTYRRMYDDKSTYSAKNFLHSLVGHAPFPICKAQTDNGTEFTNALLVVNAKHKTLFEQSLMDMGIEHQRIRIATPRHNGKVERQHRTDEMRFYHGIRIRSLDDGRRLLDAYQRESNNIIMTCLNMESPNQVLAKYLAIM